MTFEPYNSYYILTSSQYAEMESLLAEWGLPYNLAEDFTLAEDGNYYVNIGDGLVDDDELAFLDEWGLLNQFDYKKSTQSTSPV